MFDNFSTKITRIFDTISGKKFISEDDLNATMREIRIALLEADVSLPIAKEFIEKVKAEALGQQVVKSVSPGQMVVKIVHDELVKLLGGEKAEINLIDDEKVEFKDAFNLFSSDGDGTICTSDFGAFMSGLG